jgi:hypothetical protein
MIPENMSKLLWRQLQTCLRTHTVVLANVDSAGTGRNFNKEFVLLEQHQLPNVHFFSRIWRVKILVAWL